MNYQRGKKGENWVWICWGQLWAHIAGKIKPSANMQAPHQCLIFLLKEEGGSVILQPDTLLLLIAWPARAFLFWHLGWKSSFGPRKAASALMQQRCAGCPTLCQLLREIHLKLLSLVQFDPIIFVFIPNILNPLQWKIIQSGTLIFRGFFSMWYGKVFFSKTSVIKKHGIECTMLPLPPLPTKQSKKKIPSSQANPDMKTSNSGLI